MLGGAPDNSSKIVLSIVDPVESGQESAVSTPIEIISPIDGGGETLPIFRATLSEVWVPPFAMSGHQLT